MQPSYIPAKLIDFANWFANFNSMLTAAPADFGLTAPDAVIVDAVYDPFLAAYNLVVDPATKTSVTVAQKDAARASAEAIVRPYAVLISLNPAVSPEDKVAIGVTLRSTGRTPVPAPTDAPVLSLLSAIPMTATLNYKIAGSSNKAKPAGSIGVEIKASYGVVPATDPAQCDTLGTFTKSPLTISYAAGVQGKNSTYFARFTTRSGPAGVSQAGPWSSPLNVIAI